MHIGVVEICYTRHQRALNSVHLHRSTPYLVIEQCPCPWLVPFPQRYEVAECFGEEDDEVGGC